MSPKPNSKSKAKRGAALADHDESEEMAERRPLPERTVFAIEYPGYVNNADKAILTLGGPERVLRHATGDVDEEGPVELRFRYNDPASHSIRGDKVATQNLLIKVTKRTRRLKSATGEAVGPVEEVSESAEVVAVIDKTARFRKLADFQVVVPKGDPLVQIAKVLSKVDIDGAKRFCESGVLDADLNAETGYIPAPSLDRHGWSSQFSLKDITKPLRDTASDTPSAPRFNGVVVSYDSSSVPTHPTPNALAAIKELPQELLQRARDILADMPVVSRNAMDVLIPADERQGCRLVTVMCSMAYVMQTGSWRNCWIRFGYDPRKDKEAYKYQIVDMRRKSTLATSGRARVPKRAKKGTASQVLKQELALPTEAVTQNNATQARGYIFDEDAARKDIGGIFQLLHIRVPIITKLIEYSGGRRTIPCQESGWLQPSLAKLIQTKLREVKRAYSGDAGVTPDNLSIDYNELNKGIYIDSRAEKAEISNAARLREREISAASGQSSQAMRERVEANVEKLMQNLGDLDNAEASNMENYATDFDEFVIFGEESSADSQSDAAADDDGDSGDSESDDTDDDNEED
ncbi:tau 95 subunit of transcription factor TFIIIC [Coemansia sp. BCRC 34301]|nr:tau 95 subunit of transcription factor TFIIIC [Coemansia sp. BCRC 34301]